MRCFIALELSPDMHRTLAGIIEQLSKRIHGVKWVKPENIHLTLKFLGNTGSGEAEKIKGELDMISREASPFTMRLASLGAFPNPDRPRVLWAGIDCGREESAFLARSVDERLSHLGTEKESRPFHPHLTLGRIRFLRDKGEVRKAYDDIEIPEAKVEISRLILFRSTLTPQGAIYSKLHEARLSLPR